VLAGYLKVLADSSFTFTRNLRYKRTVSFSYTLWDGENESTTWVYINIYYCALKVSDGWFEGLRDQSLSGNLLGSGWDADGDSLSIVAINEVEIGETGQTAYRFGQPIMLDSGATLAVFVDGSFTYAPLPYYTGPTLSPLC